MTDQRMHRVAVNEAARNLRDQADRDYITARHVYALGFADQFMWQAQQAIEKYLKAIVLYASDLKHEGARRNPKGVKVFGHDLPKLLAHVSSMRPWQPEIAEPTRQFVRHVHAMGLNRYADKAVWRRGDELTRLDGAVWDVRRWCNGVQRTRPKGVEISAERFLQVQRAYVQRMTPGPSQHVTGLLESVIKRGRTNRWRTARASLLRWNQYYYAKRASPYLAPRLGSSAIPVHARDWARRPEILNLLHSLGVGPPSP